MMTPQSIESPDAERKMIGSLLIIEAADIVEVRKMVENDIYYTSGVVSFRFSFVLCLTLKPGYLSGIPRRSSFYLSSLLRRSLDRPGPALTDQFYHAFLGDLSLK
jgi:hypothetical protein